MRIILLLMTLLLLTAPALAAAPPSWTISGTVTNHTGSPRPAADQEVKLTAYVNGAEADWKTVKTSARGEFTFPVPPDPQRTYALQVKYKGGEYDSPSIAFKAGETSKRLTMRVFEPTSDPKVLRVNVHHIIAEAGAGMVQVAELLVFANTSDRTYIGGTPRADGKRETLRITLPAGAGNVQYMDGLMECCVFVTDTGLVDTMDVEPGMREISYAYTLPSGRGSLALTRRLDYPAERVEVFGSAAFALTVPALEYLVMRMRTTPDQVSRPASVTTNDGTPAFVMTSAWRRPMSVVTASAKAMASHQGHPGASGRSRSVMATPPTALTKATDRSISPIRRTNTMPMAMVATGANWSSRFVKLRSTKNVLSRVPKTIAMTTRPTTIGIDPSSPARMASHLRRTYPDTVSGGAAKPPVAGGSASSGVTAVSAPERAPVPGSIVTLRSLRRRPSRARGRACRR